MGVRQRRLGALLLALAFAGAARGEVMVAFVAELSGPAATTSRGAEFAAEAIDAKGGVLGRRIRLIAVDDHCDPDLAEGIARELVKEGVSLVIGHSCSGATIRAAPIYAAAGIVQISPYATNPQLTSMGYRTLFRMIGRDDTQGVTAATMIAERFGNARIAVIDDGQTYGKGLADAVRRELANRGIKVTLNRAFVAGGAGYEDLAALLERQKIDLVYASGKADDLGQMARAIRMSGGKTVFVTGETGNDQAFSYAAGLAAEGTYLTYMARPTDEAALKPVLARARQRDVKLDGFAFRAFAALEAWAQAVEASGTLDGMQIAEALHGKAFQTVLGEVSFDARGDVVGLPARWQWYRWRGGVVEAERGP